MVEKQCLKCKNSGTMIEVGVGLVVVCWGKKSRRDQIKMFMEDQECEDRVEDNNK